MSNVNIIVCYQVRDVRTRAEQRGLITCETEPETRIVDI